MLEDDLAVKKRHLALQIFDLIGVDGIHILVPNCQISILPLFMGSFSFPP